MSQPTCATCRYFGGGNRCQRSPPVWIAAGAYVQPGWWQPATEMGGWCGEHAPRPDAAGPGLPDGWRWDGDDATGPEGERIIARRGWFRMSGPSGMAHEAPIAAVEALIAAHRHRVRSTS